MIESALLTEAMALVGVLDPLSTTPLTRTTAWIDMSLFSHLLCIGQMGVGDGTVDWSVEQAADNIGTGTTTLKASGQFSATDDNKQVLINVRNKELTQGKRWVRFKSVTTGGTATNHNGVVLGAGMRYGQPLLNNAATVKQVVN